MYEMSNRSIRQRAWELCRGNFWKIFGASCFISLLVMTCTVLGMLMGTVGAMMAALATTIMMPVLEVGMIQFSGNLWNGEFASVGTLFEHTDKIGRIWGILFQILLRELPVMLAYGAVMACLDLIGEAAPMAMAVVSVVVSLAAMVLGGWVAVRLSLPTYALVLNPNLRASECIRTSWNATRGKVWRIFCHIFILMLPMIVLQVLVQSFHFFNQTSGLAAFVINFATTLLTSLFNGYLTLGQYGLAQQLIVNASSNR